MEFLISSSKEFRDARSDERDFRDFLRDSNILYRYLLK